MTIKITENDGIYYAGNVVSATYAIEQDLINRNKATLLDRDNYDDAEFSISSAGSVTGLADPTGSLTTGYTLTSTKQPTGASGNNLFIGGGGVSVAIDAGQAYQASDNVSLGVNALLALTKGYSNMGIGTTALTNVSIGAANTGVGTSALYSVTSGGNNTAVGASTAVGIGTGSGNTVLGANVGGLASGLTNNIILANGSGAIKAQHNDTSWTLNGPVITSGYTVASLPAGTVGMRAYVTDATTPTYNAALVGGGAVRVPVFFNGTAWVSA